MIKLFNRNRITINSISFPDFGWTKAKDETGFKQWFNEEQTIALSVNYFEAKPDLPSTKDVNILRYFYRDQIINLNGGLIQVDLIELDPFTAVKTVFKIPHEPAGMIYLASLTIPFDRFSFVIKIQAPEMGVTGLRSASIAAKLLKEGKISKGEKGYTNWSADPYKPEFAGGTLMNKSEKGIYDIEFPNHPLSEARNLLGRIQSDISFSDEFEKVKRFKK